MTNQQGAPEALAHELFTAAQLAPGEGISDAVTRIAALVEAQQPATHVQNPAEIEHVAGDVSKNGPESNMTQQPAPSAAVVVNPDPHAELRKTWQPGQRWQARSFRNGQWGPWTDAVASEPFWFPHQDYRRHPDDLAPQPSPTAQAASSAVLKAIREANMQLVRTGDDAFMLVTYKNAKAQCDGGQCGIGGYCDDCPTPKADSQPAPDEVADAMADSQYLAGVSAGWNAANADDPNAALQKLHESRAGYLKPLSAARAPADSVTAPAGVAYLDIGAGGYIDLGTDLSNEALSRLPKGRHVLIIAGTYGIDGYTPIPPAQAADYDHGPQSETIQEAARHVGKWLNERPNRPLDLRDVAMLCAHAQAADSVLEDAARRTTEQEHAIRQGHEIAASDGYFEARPQIDCIDRRRVFTAGFGRGWDAARKQGGA